MAMRPPFPGHTLKATFDDIRRDLEGIIVRDVTGKARAGVFPDHTDELFVRQSSMKLGVKPFRAAQVRSGVVLLANDGVELVTLAAAPSANRRIDLVYVTARSTSAPWGDAADTPTFGVIQGVASATPVTPTLPPVFADALPLFTVEIAAGATTTQAAGVIIMQVFPYTAAAGGTVIVRSMVELSAWKPADGANAQSVGDGTQFFRRDGSWYGVEERSILLDPVGSATNVSGWFHQFLPTVPFRLPFTVEPELVVTAVIGSATLQHIQVTTCSAANFNLRTIRLSFAPASVLVKYRAVGRVS